ncbi:ribose-phosphate pyrophosphokinase [Rhodospirillaceae bacterium KN72]|uniref:ribose-phosphate diphosphokinase n=1 Tax=Pacificispira spongiicola TaxID=2729598 RepID=A0A7Y0HI62_9PROT|nr:ribose-phosphate pyrophosphokinase [Pacificispira spongiicola]NMM46179.1 ribose-phosphate pyrophosphokinase [Pacificispira spongiicola]
MKPLILPMPENEALAHSLADQLDGEVGAVETRQFPDGESYIRLATPVAGRSVVFVCTLDRPDGKLLPLIFAAGAAKELRAERIGLVAPYLAYMRQDKRFQEGEAVTSTHFASVLNGWFDWMATVDPHLHRRTSLSEIYTMPTATLHAAGAIADWIREEVENPVLVGPDGESEQWVAAVAEEVGCPHTVLLKTRHGDRDVDVSVPDVDAWRDHTPILIDDIISTARTMIETVGHLKRAGMAPPICVGVHAVFAGDAYRALSNAGTGQIVTCNTIPHASNGIDLTGLLAAGIGDLLS